MTELPETWVTQSLKDWGMQAQSGFASGVHNAEGNGVIHLRPMNVSRLGKLDFSSVKSVEDDSARRIEKGDILFNNTNSAELVGKTAIIDVEGEFAFSNHMTRLRFPADKVDQKYMSILLHSYWMSGYFNEICSNHVNQASVSIKRLEQVEVSLPPIDEQHKIVELLEDHLSRLDAALTDVKQAKLKAAQFRRSLLQAAFIGNLTGDGTRLMTEWQHKTLGEIVSIKTGKIDANKAVENGKFPFFTCAREISRIDDAPYEGKVVLVAGNGDLNVKYHEGKFNAYQRTYFLTSLDESNALPKYIYFFMEHYLQILRTQSIGTTVKYIKMENLSAANIPLPTIVEQQKIVEILEDHLSRLDASVAIADAMEKQSASLRRSLLQAAFSGQLTKEVASV